MVASDRPVYLDSTFWEPSLELVEPAISGEHNAALDDPCFWDSDACDATADAATPSSLLLEEEVGYTLPPVPCLTTNDGCDLAAAAGIGGLALDPVLILPTPASEAAMSPCFWDEGCVTG